MPVATDPQLRTTRLVVYSDSSEFGGAEGSLATLVGALGPGIDVTVLGVDRAVVEWIANHRPAAKSFLVPPVRGWRDWRGTLAHLQALRRLRPDLFQVNLASPWFSLYALSAAVLVPRLRTIAVVHLPVPPPNERQRRLRRLVSRRLAAEVTVGRRTARELEALLGRASGSVRTIHNGVQEREVEPAARPVPGPLIGSSGRLHPQKGFDVLLRALPALPDVTALLVGDGRERQPLVALADELGVSERVLVTGWVSNSRSYLPALDVFVLPSRFEAFPLAIVEAMLAGLPVVATDVGSVSEAVIDGETGLLVPPEDPDALARALRRLLEDPAERLAMGERGRALARERFTAPTMAAGYESLYAELLP